MIGTSLVKAFNVRNGLEIRDKFGLAEAGAQVVTGLGTLNPRSLRRVLCFVSPAM